MKKEKKMPPASKEKKPLPVLKGKKTGPGSDPVNKFKKDKSTTAAEIDNIITGAVGNVQSRSGKGFANEGTAPFYEES
ncbi:MAG: hypothetical protein ABIP79_14330 [Chitinophagaceae bacterium]